MVRLGWSQCIAVAVCLIVAHSQVNEVLPISLDAAPTPTATPSRSSPIGLTSGATINPASFQSNLPTPKFTPAPQPQITTVVTEIPPADAVPPSADSIKPNSATLSAVLKNQALTTSPPASSATNSGYLAYLAATSAFNALNTVGGGCCDNCNVLKGVSFRQYGTKFYLTADNSYYLSLKKGESPSPQQLFTAKQNADCTWSFRSTDGLYVSLNTAFSYLTLNSQLSVGERFYMERSKDWIYVESANSYRYFWTASNGIALYAMNSAARFVMEVWPMLSVGWN